MLSFGVLSSIPHGRLRGAPAIAAPTTDPLAITALLDTHFPGAPFVMLPDAATSREIDHVAAVLGSQERTRSSHVWVCGPPTRQWADGIYVSLDLTDAFSAANGLLSVLVAHLLAAPFPSPEEIVIRHLSADLQPAHLVSLLDEVMMRLDAHSGYLVAPRGSNALLAAARATSRWRVA